MSAAEETTSENGGEDGSEARPRPGRGRRIALRVLLALVLIPVGIVSFALFYLRHVPYAIASGDRVGDVATAATPARGGLSLRWHGITCYTISDGQTTIITDPAVTRPTVLELIRGPLKPDKELSAKLVPKADFILINHAHYDHAIDAADIALRTGATVIGTASAANLMRSRGVPEAQIRVAKPGDTIPCGTFTVRVGASRHSKIMGRANPMAGTIARDAGPLWYWQYTQDGSLCYHLTGGDTSLWFHPSVSYQRGDLQGLKAPYLIQGVASGGAGIDAERFRSIFEASGARRVYPTHYDNFFQPLSKGVGLLPMVDLDQARAAALEADPDIAWAVFDHEQQIRIPPDSKDGR